MKKIIIMVMLLVLTGCSYESCEGKKITETVYTPKFVTYVWAAKVMIPVYHQEEYKLLCGEGIQFVDKQTYDKYYKGDTFYVDPVE